jgi:hypothetical protein
VPPNDESAGAQQASSMMAGSDVCLGIMVMIGDIQDK